MWQDMWVWQNYAVGGREIIPTYRQDSVHMAIYAGVAELFYRWQGNHISTLPEWQTVYEG